MQEISIVSIQARVLIVQQRDDSSRHTNIETFEAESFFLVRTYLQTTN